MGDIAARTFCEAFIKEFGEELLERYKARDETTPWILDESIAIDEDSFSVYHYMEISSKSDSFEEYNRLEVRDETTGILFSHVWDGEEMIGLVAATTGLDEDVVRARLIKAHLLPSADAVAENNEEPIG